MEELVYGVLDPASLAYLQNVIALKPPICSARHDRRHWQVGVYH
jgi:hypothetical protein